MRQPQNRGVLERSQFLNAVFAQKSFSWTAVMMDLEKVLPVGVQVTSLEPQMAKDGEVSIRLRVSGDRGPGGAASAGIWRLRSGLSLRGWRARRRRRRRRRGRNVSAQPPRARWSSRY